MTSPMLPGPEPACFGRRRFLEQTFLISVAAALGACAGAAATATLSSPRTIRLSDYPALDAVGGIAVVDNGSGTGTPIAVSRTGDTTYLALSLVCPHRGFTVEVVSGAFYCPGHGAQFAANGNWTGGQQTTNLVSYPAVYDGATGTLTIS